MIFVTVGTHEQQFNRLIEYIDKMKEEQLIQEEVIIQTGFSTYTPKFCKASKLFPYTQMVENINKARLIITHGGPSSFILPLQIGKIPIVVPRQKQFDEHVNNHQVEFCKSVEDRQRNIIVVEDIEDLAEIIIHYDEIVAKMSMKHTSNNIAFNNEFCRIVKELFHERS